MTESALQTSNPLINDLPTSLIKPDKRTKKDQKLDIAKVIKLRDINGLSFQDIANATGYSKPYVFTSYNKFKEMLPSTEELETFQDNRVSLLTGIEYKMLQNLANEEKCEKASLNNVAYAFNQIHTARRLEQGLSTGNVAISIETVYQDAEKAAKDLRKQHGKVEESINSGSED